MALVETNAGGRDETSETSVVLVSTVLVSTTDDRPDRTRDEHDARLDGRRPTTANDDDETSILLVSANDVCLVLSLPCPAAAADSNTHPPMSPPCGTRPPRQLTCVGGHKVVWWCQE